MISAHLLPLQIVIPLLSAPICLILYRPVWVRWFALAISIVSLIISIELLQQVLASGVVAYNMGDWAPPWGIEYRIDSVSAFLLFLVSMIGTVVLVYAGKSLDRELPGQKQTLFYIAFLLCLAGLLGIIITGDAFNLFVFLEISSLSSYLLISFGNDRRALTASFQYLIMGTIGATFILIGIGLMYMMTGTLNMQDLAQRLPAVIGTRTIHAAFAFLTVGVCLKLALFPLHLWLPNAYTYAPSAASAFLAATATKVAIYIMLRFMFTIYGVAFSFFGPIPLQQTLLVLATLAIFSGSAAAIYQDNIKRMLAYSSIAQIGYMIMGISFATVTGVTAGILHMFNHALMKGGLFLALGAVFYKLDGVRIENFRGLGKTMPWTMAAIVTGGLGLIGVPLTVGFVSKWYLVLAALQKGWWPVAVLILLGSLLAVAYVWRLVEAAYFQEPETPGVREAPLSLLIPVWFLIAASLYFGVNSDFTVGVATRAAQGLLGVMP